MSKRSHARIGAPKRILLPTPDPGPSTSVSDAYMVWVADPFDPVTPVRNRAEKRALVKELTRRARSGNAPDRRPVSRVR